jgi:GDP-L-fucose synthase
MRIYIAGHTGLVGSALVRAVERDPTATWIGQTRSELDLFNRPAVFEYVKTEQPDAVIIAAARVGGIVANETYPVEFLTENLQIEMSLLDACHAAKVPRVLFLGSSCIYPRLALQPIKEQYLMTGPLEPTNEPYAISKIAGISLVQSYRRQYGHRWISLMPTNLYGPGDNFDLQTSHVLPALIRRFHEAREHQLPQVVLWGTGKPMREFLHVDDLASACLYLLNNYDAPEPINVGTGEDIAINQLATIVAEIVGYKGAIRWDDSKPDGTPRKLLDVSRIHALGWRHKINLEDGIAMTYKWFMSQTHYK